MVMLQFFPCKGQLQSFSPFSTKTPCVFAVIFQFGFAQRGEPHLPQDLKCTSLEWLTLESNVSGCINMSSPRQKKKEKEKKSSHVLSSNQGKGKFWLYTLHA